MQISGHTVEILGDPFGLLKGDRYEFYLHIDVDEEDELYTENGLLLKVIFSVENGDSKILQYYFIERTSEKILEFALEDDEEKLIIDYCHNHIPIVDTN
ncbi:DUF6509 family protein [Bacillus sp. B15-48]|uniref:DUF6509 family protein n=1 Tax=Bacillus sp. B15-48 TaxID=1548601 RepID=UPI00193FC9FE|nr:DUF6509 family protein [Bacillus sp. B15-48]MBM4761984.1 pullulanase [Bacillus sp. B15-48]